MMHAMAGNHAGWMAPGSAGPAAPMYERPVGHRPSVAQLPRSGKPRRAPLRPWMLVIGALLMALLAFAVTRACIHTATRKPAAPTK
jgi:hypothetical protein